MFMRPASAYEIRDAIGDLADGMPVAPALRFWVQAALSGMCETADRGAQCYRVDLSAVTQHNVDTAELIWPNHPDSPPHPDEVPLQIITDPLRWEQARQQWMAHDPIAWTAFVWRVAVPLVTRLGMRGAWQAVLPDP
jgi:hypothetical protein